MSDTTELFTGSSGAPEASPGLTGGTPAPAGETVTDKPTRRGGSGLSGMLLADLQRLAQSMGITGTGRMRKSQLIEAIQSKQGGGATQSQDAPARAAAARPGPRRATGVGHSTTQSSVARLREPARLATVSRTPWSQTPPHSPPWAAPRSHQARRRKQPRRRARRGGTGPATRPRPGHPRTGCPGQRRRRPAPSFSPSSAAGDTAASADAGQAANGAGESAGRADGQPPDGQRRERRQRGRRDDSSRDGGEQRDSQRDGNQRDNSQRDGGPRDNSQRDNSQRSGARDGQRGGQAVDRGGDDDDDGSGRRRSRDRFRNRNRRVAGRPGGRAGGDRG